jgi:putative amino-acid transport system substrate-binding protein/putative amino-acid transport system permease protein
LKKKLALLVISVIVLTLSLTGCTQEPSESKKVKDSTSTEVTKIIKVGMSGGYKPYTFQNESGELVGFDVSVWKAIGEKIGAQVEFETSEFSGLFGKLDNKQITTIANQITVTEERQEKYLFSSPYVYYGAQLVVHSDNNDVINLDTLKGKKVGVSLGSNYETLVREFDVNKEIEIITYEDYQASLRDVSLGRIDAVLNDKLAGLTAVIESGLDIKLGGEPVSELFNAFPLVKSAESEALLVEINEAIATLKEDGTLSAISLEWFPIDITEE